MSFRLRSDHVSLLHGCGRATVEKLVRVGIITYGDLIDYKGFDKSINKLRSKAKEAVDKKEISCHSWKGYVAHIIRNVGMLQRIERAIVGNLIISPHMIELDMSWKSINGNTIHKHVSPIMLVSIQQAWKVNDIVSGVSDDIDSSDSGYDDKEKYRCEDVLTMLPVFQVDVTHEETKNLNPHEWKAIRKLEKETRQFKLAFDLVSDPLLSN